MPLFQAAEDCSAWVMLLLGSWVMLGDVPIVSHGPDDFSLSYVEVTPECDGHGCWYEALVS
jgi:hypothetical protein